MPADAPTIAVIDDDESVRRALRRFIDLLGYNVETFATAEEFLESFLVPDSQAEAHAAEAFRCVILDQHLPGGVGGLQWFRPGVDRVEGEALGRGRRRGLL